MYVVAAYYGSGTFSGLYHVWYYKSLQEAEAGLLERKANTKNLIFMPIMKEI